MSIDETKDLQEFLSPFEQEKQKLVLWLREFVWKAYPNCNELIYDNYNALAFGWSLTDKLGSTFCSIALGRSSKNIHFGFFHGKALKDPEQKLIGEGNQYRYMLVTSKKDFPKKYVLQLMGEAYVNALAKLKAPKEIRSGLTIVKSVSEKKRASSQPAPGREGEKKTK
jgi:hypothetical protein